MACAGMFHDSLITRAEAAIEAARSLRIDRRALAQDLGLAREKLRENVLKSSTMREQVRQSQERPAETLPLKLMHQFSLSRSD